MTHFLLQKPAHISGARVVYDAESCNLYTVNASTASRPNFYQTFGDLVLNFDGSNGRLYSLDGRIRLDIYESNLAPKHQNNSVGDACLITEALDMCDLAHDVKYAFDGKVLTIYTPAKADHFGRLMENVTVGLTTEGELAEVRIAF